MTISTNNVNKVNAEIQKSKQKEQKNARDLFSDIMNMASMGGTKEMSDENRQTISASEKTASPATDYNYSGKVNSSEKTDGFAAGQKNNGRDVGSSKTETKKYDKTDAAGKAGKTQNTDSVKAEDSVTEDVADDEITEDAKAILSSMIQELIALLTKELGISEDALNAGLDGMNIGIGDLLDPDMLKSFILNVNDATDVNLLIDESLVNMITSLTEDVAGLSDEIKQLLSELGMDADDAALTKLLNESANGALTADEALIWTEEKSAADTFAAGITADAAAKENGGADDVKAAENNPREVTYTPLNADNNVGNNHSNAGTAFDFSDWSSEETDSRPDDSLNMNFAQAVGQAFQNTDVSMVSETSTFDGVDIVRQIVDDIKAHVTKDTTALEVHLNPENLGKVTITVTEKDGALQAKIIAETEAAKNAIETGLANLKEAFENQELKVEAIEVMVGMQDFLQSDEDHQAENDAEKKSTDAKGAINLDDDLEEDTLTDEQKLQVEMMRMAGNRVNYSI